MIGEFSTPVFDCSRCGADHELVTFRKLETPEAIDGFEFTHVGVCPADADGELLLRFTTDTARDEYLAGLGVAPRFQ